MNRITRELKNSMRSLVTQKTKGYNTRAEVTRVEGDIAWVHIPGGVNETPVKMSINAKKGDTVRIQVEGGGAWITGNDTAPPTDDSTAKRLIQENSEPARVDIQLRNVDISTGYLQPGEYKVVKQVIPVELGLKMISFAGIRVLGTYENIPYLQIIGWYLVTPSSPAAQKIVLQVKNTSSSGKNWTVRVTGTYIKK